MSHARNNHSGGVKATKLSRAARRATRSERSEINELGWFTWFAHETARMTGKPAAFILAALTIVVWAATGPLFNYSDTWQLVINTGTTIITFLMVFLIQSTQNRDTMALQIKLAELIIAVHGAENRLAAAEDLCDADLEALHKVYRKRAEETLDSIEQRAEARKLAELPFRATCKSP